MSRETEPAQRSSHHFSQWYELFGYQMMLELAIVSTAKYAGRTALGFRCVNHEFYCRYPNYLTCWTAVNRHNVYVIREGHVTWPYAVTCAHVCIEIKEWRVKRRGGNRSETISACEQEIWQKDNAVLIWDQCLSLPWRLYINAVTWFNGLLYIVWISVLVLRWGNYVTSGVRLT